MALTTSTSSNVDEDLDTKEKAKDMEGELYKWTNVMRGWQPRWFVLSSSSGLLWYATSRDKMNRGIRRGCVRLLNAHLGIDDEDERNVNFTITVDGKTFHFQAKDVDERDKWTKAIENAIVINNDLKSNTDHEWVRLRRRHGHQRHLSHLSVAEVEKKLAETDSYLALLIDQTDSLERSIGTKGDQEDNNEKLIVVQKSKALIESVKQAILLLQMAKSAASTPEDNLMTASVRESDQKMKDNDNKDHLENSEDNDDELEQGSNRVRPLPSNMILMPETSYSSSEDDDDFYDAVDGHHNFNNSVDDHNSNGNANKLEYVPEEEEAQGIIVSKNDEPNADEDDSIDHCVALVEANDVINQSVDYDALYSSDGLNESESLDMKNHGSVLSHLLSQVRIGMDLTKIVLPTFILERRSLLEMYSDFFAHPNLFLSVCDGTSPEDRLVRVVRWYLSSFHAGRRSAVAKKPYNPILGETFRCHWTPFGENEEAEQPNMTKYVKDGPLPWCDENELTFVAEQVSHHPPISAFYAEHPKKRITVNAHIYTKSSFLGLSVAVHNVGQGKLTLLSHNEDYVCTFPSGYGRSILSVPWVELGGKVSVLCPQTNYSAHIEFKCKPFFSNEVHRVVAELFRPREKKPFLRVEGAWNGRMMAKWTQSGRSEIFVDVKTMPYTFEKKCKPINQQGSFESRRLWRDVTLGLKANNMDNATIEKQRLEQRQRDEAKSRKEMGKSWETKLFTQIGDNWYFNSPLEARDGK